MDWMRLFAFLMAVASVQIAADGSKKKIRIHLPQKVKHIHHHKKIYITNHHAPASSQYAPAFLPSAEGAVAVPTNIALPSVASVVPLNSVELVDDAQHRIPGVAPASSKLLPLYRARGYYGPTPSEWDEQEYDVAAPSEPSDNSYPPAPYVPPTGVPPAPPPKRVKIVKPKKGVRRPKPKRVPVRGKPPTEEEHPVSKFHEHFYSDLNGSGTIKKVKKPQRVEKIVDGDTEHIHTYSEEHIHKLVFDDGSKLSNVLGVDPVASMSGITAGHPLMPFKNSLLAIPSDNYPGFAVGSLGTPSHLEYTAYNPRDVTHDHIFHDHGEIPADLDLSREPLGFPPKVSYNSQGLRISDGAKSQKAKYSHKYLRGAKPTVANDLSYYESLYTANRIKKHPNPAVSHIESSLDSNPVQDYRPIPAFNFLGKNPNKIRSTYNGQPTQDYRSQHANKNFTPYSVSSTIVHDYQPKPTYPGALPPTGFSKFKNPVVNFNSNNYDYDAYASSSNILFSEDKNDNADIAPHSYKGKKKSVSTQNISFGGQDHQTMVDHFGASSVVSEAIHEEPPSAFEDVNSYDNTKASDNFSPTPYTIKETSPAHLYYTAMAMKALYNEPASMPEASNDNLQYAEPPTPSDATTPYTPSVATTTEKPNVYFEIQPSKTSENPEQTSNFPSDNEQRTRVKHRHSTQSRDSKQRYSVIQDLRSVKELESENRLARKFVHQNQYLHDSAIDSRGKLKYGDKI
ncbi:uncharacterized protein LOC106133778 [Amyelois transitella]|uniref:uncharacterized protein LOC106133778 n=1 Tax=Amyelois transitella TaxID=680683 RepID=UPI00298FC4E4|nr:uncharacterized protein LOC106133778 [Amyelois transitella]